MRAVRYGRAAAALALATLWLGCICCYHLPSGPVERSEVVGHYVLRMDDRGAPYHSPDQLTLEGNGTYVLTRMPGGRSGAVERGAWTVDNGPQPSVELRTRGYPIEFRGKRLRLVVNDDLGYYWYKVEK